MSKRRQIKTKAKDVERKLSAIRTAAQHAFPAPPIDQMNDEIERNYTRERHQILENLTLDELLAALNSPGTSNTRKD